eukprot:6546830-Prymnesium_polylepis.2
MCTQPQVLAARVGLAAGFTCGRNSSLPCWYEWTPCKHPSTTSGLCTRRGLAGQKREPVATYPLPPTTPLFSIVPHDERSERDD